MAKRKATVESTPVPTEDPAASSRQYTVLARRYRPQQFTDLVGQEPVAQALSNAIQSGRVAHAYLFTGARGVGKTSAARILAKALNCEKGPTTTPCDQCEMCKSIATGEDVDVLEIDGASNRGIDEVREVRANVQYRPQRGRFKIYIIDEVHMLTTQAFNALLKTLEEPPSHVKFIFATTEISKIPITILSRCQRFDFGGISIPRIVDRLRGIVTSEQMKADDEALEIIARRAGGSMRDAQSLLDQLLAFGGDHLTVERMQLLLGTASEDRVVGLAKAIFARDAKAALGSLADAVDHGVQVGEVLDQLIDYWRDLMVVQCAGAENQPLSVGSTHRPILTEQAKRHTLETHLAGLDVLTTTKARLRNSTFGRVLVEMALVRLCQLEDLVPLGQLTQFLLKEGITIPVTTGPTPTSARSPAAPSTAPSQGGGAEKKNLIAVPSSSTVAPSIPFLESNLPQLWQQLLSNSGFAAQSALRKVTSHAIFGPNILVLQVEQRYNVGERGFLDPAHHSRIEAFLGTLCGQPIQLRVEFIPNRVESAGDGVAARSPEASSLQMRQLRAEVQKLALVSRAEEVLGAKIIHVESGFGNVGKNTAEAETDEIESAS